MGVLRIAWAATAAIVVTLVLSACAASTAAPTAEAVTALGDSVPRGTHCDCKPYPPLTAKDLATATGRAYATDNDSVAGATSADLLSLLRRNRDVIADVRGADVIEIEIGANDVGYTGACSTDAACYAARIPALKRNLAAIVGRAKALAGRRKPLIVLLDYWSVWLGGKYATAKGPAYVNAAEQLTDEVNAVIRSTATRTGSAYVDLRAAFKGPDYSYDETHYLASDGDHPNAAGHRKIASAAGIVIRKALRL